MAHLFTGKETTDGGLALGLLCDNPANAYSFTRGAHFELWISVAHEIGHTFNANHPNQVNPPITECNGTIMQGVVHPSGATQFCQYSRNQITNYVNTYGGCLHYESIQPSLADFDFDADGESDVSLFRPSNTYWYIERSTNGFASAPWGLATDKIAPADYDGDDMTDIAVFRDGTFFLLRSTAGFTSVNLGAAGDIPVPGDFTGDDQAELAVFRPSNGTWYTYDLTNNQSGTLQFGQSGDKPFARNFDGDQRDDYALYRPSNGMWYLLQSTDGYSAAMQFGLSTDIPVPADYDGDGRADFVVFRPSNGTWYMQRTALGYG